MPKGIPKNGTNKGWFIFQGLFQEKECSYCKKLFRSYPSDKQKYCNPRCYQAGRKKGEATTRFYRIWAGIKSRCTNPNRRSYSDYGERGIKCHWKSFNDFKNDMYDSYVEHYEKYGEPNTTIDRIDNERGYSWLNCVWSTLQEQSRNKRCSLYATFNGQTKLLGDWAEELGIKYNTLYNRIFVLNFSIEKALTYEKKRSKS